MLISCSPARIGSGGTATETTTTIPSSTSLLYWDLLPLSNDPRGGWTLYRLEDSFISFQYPSVYKTGNCGTIFTEYKIADNYKALLFGFEGSSIRIHVFDEWESELYDTVKESQPPSYVELVTSVERFSIGGIPAVRYVAKIPNSKTLDYSKTAMAYYRGKIYVFSYANLSYLSSCEAPPLTEEQVYEYIISTIEFLE